MVIRTEHDYTNICDSLGVHLEYGPLAIPKYGTWMAQMEATLIKFFAMHTSYFFKMANVRTAFNACRCLTYCDELLVSLGHRIWAIQDYASMHNPPNRDSSAASSFSAERKGNDSPISSRDTQDSAENCVDVDTEHQGAAVGNIENNSHRNSPPCKLDSERENPDNLRTVFEYEDISNQIELTNENIQGIVSLRLERDQINGETCREILQKLNPTVVLDDVNKKTNGKGHFESK